MTNFVDTDGPLGTLMPTYAPSDVTFVRGAGSRLWDEQGKRYLDFLGGIAVTSLGHCHPTVTEAIVRQSQRLWHVSNLFHNELALDLATSLDRLIGNGNSLGGGVFFANSGAEAVECAIKLSRRHAAAPGSVIVATNQAFHGRTMGALAATGQPSKQEPFQPLLGGFRHVAYADIAALEDVLDPSVAAVIVEPIQGEAGVVTPPEGYLSALRRICDERGMLLILDEIQTGLGRTGAWFAAQHESVVPDIVTVAKALGNGMPISACWAKAEVAAAFRPGDHGTTFGGQPLAVSAAIATLKVMEEQDVPSRAATSGALLRQGLVNLPGISEVRGMGLLLGAVLDNPNRSAAQVVRECLSLGLVVNAPAANVIRLAPSLLVSEEEISEALDILDSVLSPTARPTRRSGRIDAGASNLEAPATKFEAPASKPVAPRHFLEVDDLTPSELNEVLRLAKLANPQPVLSGLGMALLFEHPSARTRNAAEMAVVQLGGHPVTVRGEEVGIDTRETAEDVARTLGSYHHGVLARVSEHRTLERFVSALDGGGWDVSVVNLLSDRAHPTQALADLFVLNEHFGSLKDKRIAWIGDANNVCRSLIFAAAMVGVEVAVASPSGYGLDQLDIERATALGGAPIICDSPRDAAHQADALYTDVWISMGQEDQARNRREAFSNWGITEDLFSYASSDAVLLHCLPAHRGEEVSEEVLEGPRSLVWAQASARRNVLVGLLLFLYQHPRRALCGPAPLRASRSNDELRLLQSRGDR